MTGLRRFISVRDRIEYMTPNNAVMYLTHVDYVEETGLVSVSFENGSDAIVRRFPFVPSLLTSAGKTQIESVLCGDEKEQLRFESLPTATRVFCQSEHLLKRLQDILQTTSGAQVLCPMAATQFLLAQQWHYFDSFAFAGNWPQRLNRFELPFTSFGFLSNNLHVELSQLLKESPSTAQGVVESLVFSRLLRLPVTALPKGDFEKTEAFLANLFFVHGLLPPPRETVIHENIHRPPLPLHVFENTAEFDFSHSVLLMITRPFYNLGFETINCACCTPQTASDAHLLPHARVKVRMLSDGFFFESKFPAFAHEFHRTQPNKTARQSRQQEFGHLVPPVGPFWAGEIADMPLSDALSLESTQDGLVIGLSGPVWTCRKNESFLSKALAQLSEEIVLLSREAAKTESDLLSTKRLGAYQTLSFSPSYFFQSNASELLSRFAAGLVGHLADASSRFFARSLAQSLESGRVLALARFFEFNQSRGLKTVVPSQGTKAFVQRSDGFSLAKEFAVSASMPLPRVAEWHFARRQSF